VGIGASLAIVTLAIAINKARPGAEDRAADSVEAGSVLPPPPPTPIVAHSEPASSEPRAADHIVTAVEKSPKPKEPAPRGGRATTGRNGNTPANKPAAKPMAAKPAASSAGALALNSTPACDITIDGKPTGLRTPQPKIKLDAGTHSVTLISSAFAIRETFSIEIKPGELITQTKDYSNRIVETSPDGNTTLNPFKKPQVHP
jgi:hypothetical protein